MNENKNNPSLRSELHSLKKVQLTEQERTAMKSRLLSYADMHEAPAARPALISPFSFEFSSRLVLSSSLAFVLLLGTTGVTLAAQDTVPGQPLYAVKVGVTEPIEGAIITATSGKVGDATWQNTLAERRLHEAAQLAASNKLASSTQEYLAQQVAVHVSASEQDSDDLARSGATTAALQARVDLAAHLTAHAEVLAFLADRLESSGNASTTIQVATLATKIRGVENAVATAASSTEVALETTNSDGIATSTPALAINTEEDSKFEAQTRTEAAHILRQELRALNLVVPVATTSTTTASTTSSKTASSTSPRHHAGSEDSASSTEETSSFIKSLKLLQD